MIVPSQRFGSHKNSFLPEAVIHGRQHLVDGGLREVADGPVPDDNVITGARERELGRIQTKISDVCSRVVTHGNLERGCIYVDAIDLRSAGGIKSLREKSVTASDIEHAISRFDNLTGEKAPCKISRN